MRVIENFFFTRHRGRKYTCIDLFPVHFDGGLSKQRSPFASEDVLIGL